MRWGNPFTMYTYIKSPQCTLYYNFICQLHCNKAEMLKKFCFEYTIIPFCLCLYLECTLCCIPPFCLYAICFILFFWLIFFLFFFFLTVLCGLQDLSFPTRIKPGPWQWKHQVLTIGPLWKSFWIHSFFKILF